MKIKRFVSFFFACIVGFMSVFFSYPYYVYADSNNKPKFDWSTMDRDKWGVGKSYDECSDDEKLYRNRQLVGMYADKIGKGSFKLLNIVAPGSGNLAADAFSGFESALITHSAIKSGATTYTEYLIHNSGLGYLYDKDYGDDMPDPDNLDMTFSPDFLNELNNYVHDYIDNNSDIVNLNVFYSEDSHSYMHFYDYNSMSDENKGKLLLRKNFVQSKLKNGWPVFADVTHSLAAEGYTGTSSVNCFAWVEEPLSDFVFYLYSSVSKLNNKKYGTFVMRRKDNQPFTVHYYQPDGTMPYIEATDQKTEFMHLSSEWANVPSVYGGGICESGRGFIYPDFTFGFYRSAGHMTSAMTYGPQIPPIIQGSSAANTIYDHPMTVNSHDIVTYDYSTVVNNINSEPGMNAEELQNRIDEVLTEMGAISGNTEEIKENTELQVSWLRKIYDKLCDVYDKMDNGLSVGQVFEWEWLQVKLDAIIALLGFDIASDWFDDLTDAGADVIDVATDVGDAIVLKFPFCLPWDMMLILNALKAIPETPVFEIPVDIDSWNLHEKITLDLSNFQILSDVSKWFFDILYGFAITKLTLKILQVEIVGTSG